ncbi:MAG: hypothetical protein HY331_18305 [Chloroflexi bacterium]|nr:hypothetical protein [Chloroflexota bacterium]
MMSSNSEPGRQRVRAPRPEEAERGAQSGGQPSEQAEPVIVAARGVLEAGGGRAIVMTEQAYVLLLQIIAEHAPHILKYAFYDLGYRAGIDLMRTLPERAADPEATFRHLVEQYTRAGYGTIAVTHFDLAAPEARLSGTELFEAGLAPKTGIFRTPRAVDHYSRGMFAGFLSELLTREVICEEVACEFRGDPACEFIILPFQE